MVRRLVPLCLCLALWGCDRSVPPPAGTTAPAAGAPPAAAAPAASPPTVSQAVDPGGGSNPRVTGAGSEEPAAADTAERAADDGGEGKTGNADSAPKKRATSPVESAMTRFRRARTPKAREHSAADLEKALAAEPDNVEGLVFMVQALLVMSEDADDEDEPTEALHHKSVVFLEKARQADPDVEKIRGFHGLAAAVYFEDARALAREKKEADSLSMLKKAVAQGYPLQELEDEDDLDAVRRLPEFTAFIARERERIEAATREEVAQMFADHKPFELDFDLKDIAGNKLAMADLKGKVLILDFWGTWCPPCRMEIPHFVALDREYRAKGLQIIGCNREQEDDPEIAAKLVRQFCEKEGVRYPCALIDDDLVEKVPDFEGFPTTLFLDRTGKVRMKAVGYHDLFFLRTAVETLLNEEPADAAEKTAGKTGE